MRPTCINVGLYEKQVYYFEALNLNTYLFYYLSNEWKRSNIEYTIVIINA